MKTTLPAHRTLSPLMALAFGLLLLLVAIALAEATSGSKGHRIAFEKLPLAAQKIAKENHPTPISPDQWKRIDKVMERQGGWPSGVKLLQATVRSAWLVLVLLQVLAWIALRSSKVHVPITSAVAFSMPSTLALLAAWLFPSSTLLAG